MKIRDNRNKPEETPAMPDRIRLDGRVAVVTGAAGVIGTATIRLLAERGARVVKSFRGASEGERTRNPEVISARFRVRASRAPE